MSDLPEILLHIGAGKTGSTSIQFTLKQSRELLLERGTAYVGLMLEQIPWARQHEWCVDGKPQKFFQVEDRKKASDEVFGVVREALDRYARRGIRQVIWSNEAFLPRWDRILDVVQRLDAEGVPIRVICYVRRHDKWARSGYVQFGIKFKTYTGPLRSFAEWVEAQDIGYFQNLEVWQKAFPGKLELYNFDEVGDVVTHFLEKAGLEGIEPVRANESPGNALLAAWAVFNNRIEGKVLPDAFTRIAKPMRILNQRGKNIPPIEELLPTAVELVAVQDRYRGDLERVNMLLAENGEPPMIFDVPDEKDHTASSWEIDQMLLQMVFALQKQVLELQNELAALKKKDLV